MEYRRNALFFNRQKTKKWTTVSYVSYGFIVLAAVVFILTGQLPPALPFACVGVAILLTAINMMTSESHIKQQITLLQEGAKEAALQGQENCLHRYLPKLRLRYGTLLRDPVSLHRPCRGK